MKDVLDMVDCVVDSHSMSDAPDTHDTIFRSRSSCPVDSSGSNKQQVPPRTESAISNTRGSRHIVAPRLAVNTGL